MLNSTDFINYNYQLVVVVVYVEAYSVVTRSLMNQSQYYVSRTCYVNKHIVNMTFIEILISCKHVQYIFHFYQRY